MAKKTTSKKTKSKTGKRSQRTKAEFRAKTAKAQTKKRNTKTKPKIRIPLKAPRVDSKRKQIQKTVASKQITLFELRKQLWELSKLGYRSSATARLNKSQVNKLSRKQLDNRIATSLKIRSAKLEAERNARLERIKIRERKQAAAKRALAKKLAADEYERKRLLRNIRAKQARERKKAQAKPREKTPEEWHAEAVEKVPLIVPEAPVSEPEPITEPPATPIPELTLEQKLEISEAENVYLKRFVEQYKPEFMTRVDGSGIAVVPSRARYNPHDLVMRWHERMNEFKRGSKGFMGVINDIMLETNGEYTIQELYTIGVSP